MTRARLAWIVVAAGVAVGFIAQNDIPVGVFHDDGQYMLLARSIAEHGTYRFDNLPGSPPGLHYPPGYPLFLALVWKLAPGDVQAFRVANAMLLGLAALAIFAFARAVFGLGSRGAAAVSLAVVASAPFVWFNSMLISETLFVTLLCAALAFEARSRDGDAVRHAGVGALAGCVALVRSLGDPLGAIFVGERLIRRKWRDAAIAGGAWLAVLLPWKLWLSARADEMPAAFTGAYGDYAAWWRAAVNEHGGAFVKETVAKNVSEIPVTLSVLGWDGVPVMRWVMPAIVAAVAFLGIIRAPRARVAFVYAALYVSVVFIWPFTPDRFLLVLAPLVAAAFAVGVRSLRGVAARRGRAYTWCAAAVALTVAAGMTRTYDAALRVQPWEHGLGQRGVAGSAAARLAEALPPSARIATDFDELVHLRTGREVVPALGLTAAEYVRPASDSVAGMRLRELIAAHDITHVVVADSPTLRAVSWLNAHGVALSAVVSDSAGAVVYVRVPATPPTGQ